MLSKIATNHKHSKGRLFQDDLSLELNCFQIDRDRIINSGSFRRLAYKTQVFANHVGDHYRTRLTHSLEVAQIARTIAKSMNLCEDLAETLALSHDMGHPPFGHAGEEALNLCMAEYGGFDHNAQTIKIVTELEKCYAQYDGLNLSWETLEGIVKHNGPLTGQYTAQKKDLDPVIKKYNSANDLDLDKFASLEAQIASLSDDIAYNNHDLEDGCRAGIIFIDELEPLELMWDIIKAIKKKHGNLSQQRLIFESIRHMKHCMIIDLIDTTNARIKSLGIETHQDVKNANQNIACFSESFEQYNKTIKKLLMTKVYKHYQVNKMTHKAKDIVQKLFTVFMNDASCLPTEWQNLIDQERSNDIKARVICDYIAGMTDRFVIKEYMSFFDLSQRNILY